MKLCMLEKRINNIVPQEDWELWGDKIPYISFPSGWQVRAIPPFGGAVIRYNIKDKTGKAHVSIYLDCYDIVGAYGAPYWEVYPCEGGDAFRCEMDNVGGLLEAVQKSMDEQLNK